MMYWSYASLVLVCYVVREAQSVDYCKADLCRYGKNVGCHPPKPHGPECSGKSPKVVTLNPKLRSEILDRHNKLRSELATGKLRGFQPAARLPTLVWDEELANQAGNNARSCSYGHDECRNTKNFQYAGQNIAIKQYFGMEYTVPQLINEFILAWWNEYKDASQSIADKYPTQYSGPVIGHWTQLANDRTWKVGCALMNWKDGSYITYYFVCDYSFTNLYGEPVYTKGRKASKCQKGESKKYPGLCAEGEPIKSEPNPKYHGR